MEPLLKFLTRIIPQPIFSFFQPAYHLLLAATAAVRYGFPSRRLTVIGVTGTDGKTTVVHLLHEMLSSAGHRVGSLSSLRFKILSREEPNFLKMTMPGRSRLQKFLAECRRAGCRYVILEVTSQGIAQFRHRFISFAGAVLTNVTPEHIEAHGGFEAYRASKLELFGQLSASGWAVLNREDPSAELFAMNTRAQAVWYSRSAIELGRTRHPVRVGAMGPERIELEIGATPIRSGLGGAFNVPNILAAAVCALAFGAPLSAIAAALGRVSGIPGRLEYVQRNPFAVVVDYANTPAAYERVYQTLVGGNSKFQIPNSKLICVFGAPGGGRDTWKRPKLGEIAARYCKEIILTSDDPDEEDPASIAEEIRAGIPTGEFSTGSNSTMYSSSEVEKLPHSEVVLDRRNAIREALRAAQPGNTVIITGMGAQPWRIVKGKNIPWDDRKIAREELARLER